MKIDILDPCMDNQETYCKNKGLPLFAMGSCYHSYPWTHGRYDNAPKHSLTGMLVYRHGSLQKALEISATQFITACPVCSRAWDD